MHFFQIENQEFITNGLSTSTSQSSLVRNLIDTIESNASTTSNVGVNHTQTNNSNNIIDKKPTVKYSASTVNNHLFNNNNNNNSTDTDDAKMISSRVRSNSSTQEMPIAKGIPTSSSSSSSLAQTFYSNNHSIYSTLPFNRTNKNNINDWNSLTTSNGGANPNTDALANLVKQYGVSKRNALMKWCQERLVNYKNIDIKNFSSSWNDGLAFCALIHSFMPDRIDYDILRQENNPVSLHSILHDK
jgi:hypothetical protein